MNVESTLPQETSHTLVDLLFKVSDMELVSGLMLSAMQISTFKDAEGRPANFNTSKVFSGNDQCVFNTKMDCDSFLCKCCGPNQMKSESTVSSSCRSKFLTAVESLEMLPT